MSKEKLRSRIRFIEPDVFDNIRLRDGKRCVNIFGAEKVANGKIEESQKVSK